MSFVSEFCTDIARVPRIENVVADALCHQYNLVNTIQHRLADINLEQLAKEEEQDGILASLSNMCLDVDFQEGPFSWGKLQVVV